MNISFKYLIDYLLTHISKCEGEWNQLFFFNNLLYNLKVDFLKKQELINEELVHDLITVNKVFTTRTRYKGAPQPQQLSMLYLLIKTEI